MTAYTYNMHIQVSQAMCSIYYLNDVDFFFGVLFALALAACCRAIASTYYNDTSPLYSTTFLCVYCYVYVAVAVAAAAAARARASAL